MSKKITLSEIRLKENKRVEIGTGSSHQIIIERYRVYLLFLIPLEKCREVKDIFTLYSNDSPTTYKKSLTLTDNLLEINGFPCLIFDNINPELSYSLKVEMSIEKEGSIIYIVFDKVPYNILDIRSYLCNIDSLRYINIQSVDSLSASDSIKITNTPSNNRDWDVNFLYQNQPIDTRDYEWMFWQVTQEKKWTMPTFQYSAFIVLTRSDCRCHKCIPRFPAPESLVSIESVYFNRQSIFGIKRILFPIEFSEVVTPKIMTVTFNVKKNFSLHFWKRDFQSQIEKWRFRTDHPFIKADLFWADKKARVTDCDVKVVLTINKGVKVGDRIRLVLQENDEQTGYWKDHSCLPDAITIGKLDDLPSLSKYFGNPDLSIADVGIFLNRKNLTLTFRIPKHYLEKMKEWLNSGDAIIPQIGVTNHETALIVGLMLLLYLEEEYGTRVAEFFYNPITFIEARYKDYKTKNIEKVEEEATNKLILNDFNKTVLGKVILRLEPEHAPKIGKMHATGMNFYNRAVRFMKIAEIIAKGFELVHGAIKISKFVDAVFRQDTIYSTNDLFFFVTLQLDEKTLTPNGIVHTNYIPITLGDFVESMVDFFYTTLVFWESGNIWHLELLNIDEYIRLFYKVRAQSESEGKDVCYICKEEKKDFVFFSKEIDSQCSACGQKYHCSCMESEFGDADCIRCMQRDVVKSED